MAQKITLITGCSTGIGLTTAVKLAKDAAKKYLVYSTMRNLGKSQELEAASGDALNDTMRIRPLDVVKDDSVSSAVKDIIDEHGRIDLLINNAGIASFNPIEYTSVEEIKDVLETNFFGTLRMIRAVLPHMKEQRSGHIINVSSITGILGFPFYETYCASKWAIEGLTESLAVRMKAFDVKISNINPGPVTTNINDNIAENNRFAEWQNVDSITRNQLMMLATHQRHFFENRALTPDQIADLIKDLAGMPGFDKRPMRFVPNDYGVEWAAKRYSEVGAQTWTDFARFLIDAPAENSEQKHTGTKI